MSLSQRIADLAGAIGRQVKTRISADHPGVARAWVSFGYVGSATVILASFNVQSVTRSAAGKYRVTFATPMKDANYCWSAFARNAGSQTTLKVASARVTAEVKTTDYVEVICASQAGTLSDTSELNLMVYR
ncbi:MAG: hypothetical protein ACOYNZ_17520 [Rhodoferax sp.]